MAFSQSLLSSRILVRCIIILLLSSAFLFLFLNLAQGIPNKKHFSEIMCKIRVGIGGWRKKKKGPYNKKLLGQDDSIDPHVKSPVALWHRPNIYTKNYNQTLSWRSNRKQEKSPRGPGSFGGNIIFNKQLQVADLWWNSDTGSHLSHAVDIHLFGIIEQPCCAPLI